LNKGKNKNENNATAKKNMTQIVPIEAGEDENENITEGEQDQQQQELHRITSLSFTPTHHLGHFGEEHVEAQNIYDNFHMHEEGLRSRTEKRQKRAKRHTQLRLVARKKLKDSKALHRFPAFSDLTDDEVNTLIDRMEHITRFKNDAICHQHDSSELFYIIVKGSAVATIDDEVDEIEVETGQNVTKDVKCRTVAKTLPEQIEVGRIDVLGCFGEGSLANEESHICTATVTVDSDRCELLCLKRKDFLAMDSSSTTFQDHHDDHKSVLEQLNEIKMKRTKSNRDVLKRRRSSKQIGGVGEGAMNDVAKPKSLKEKGVPALLAIGSGNANERSLFS
jgi:CRP-like cAMP-binding protein